ncbi:recombinase family protein [Enterobacter mori]|uniref:recombinase family protein n=1 Tax=Enterobacter mori TaxID=539813 RepID=UPI00398A558F
MSTYAYMRVSTDKQDTASQATWLAQHSIEPANIYTDEGKSGKSFKGRSGWLALASILQAGDVLYVFHLDRVSRHLPSQLLIAEELLKYKGVRIITAERELEYDLNLKVKALLADELLADISAKTKAGIKAAREAGKQIGRPTGSKYSEQVKELFNQGVTKSEIARQLNITRVTVNKALLG